MSIYEKLTKPKEAKPTPPPKHKLDSYIGHCPDCDAPHISDDLNPLIKTMKDVREQIRKRLTDKVFVCENCGTPLAKDKEEAAKLDACWWCGHTKVTSREKWEKKHGS